LASAIALGLALAWPVPATATDADPGARRLSAGKLLVAKRSLRDPNFGRTLVLLLGYDAEGAMGLIINRPTATRLSAAFPEIDALGERDGPVYRGGPVDRQMLFMLARSEKKLRFAELVAPEIWASRSQDLLERLLRKGQVDVRVYAGYSGWGPGQLDREVARGDWLIAPADAEVVFADDPESAWGELQSPAPELITRR